MVEAPEAGLQTVDAIPQTRPGRQLPGQQVYHLALAGKRPGLPASTMLGFQLGKMMSGNQSEHTLKDCVTMSHGPEYPVCLIGYG